jgi:ABC-type glycerol-3-phosphate transport system substrate-binding protein
MDNKKLLIYAGAGLGVLILIIIIVTIFSSGGKSGVKVDKNAKITLNFWDPIDKPEIFKDIIKQYETENPNIKVNYFNKPLADYETESTKAISAGTGPDVWAIPNSSILANINILSSAPDDLLKKSTKDKTSIEDSVKDKYVPIVAQENMVNDENGKSKLYGLPLFVDTLALYVNPNLLHQRTQYLIKNDIPFNQDAFIIGPKSWNDLVDMVKQYTVIDNGTIQKSAIALGRNDNVDNAPDILALLMMQDGATMASADGLTATFNLPSATKTDNKYYPGAQALNFFTSFSDPNSPNYTWNNTFPSSYQAFKDGQTAMMINYKSVSNNLAQENPNLQFKVWPMPQINGAVKATDFASYWTLTVPKSGLERDNPKYCQQETLPTTCQKTLASWNFIKFLQSDAISTYLANSNLPSPFIPRSMPDTVLARTTYGSPFNFQKQTAKSWYEGRDAQKVENEFGNMINGVTDLHQDFQNAVDTAATNVSLIFRTREGFSTNPSPTEQKVNP